MSDFKQAIKWLKEGKKVRRKDREIILFIYKVDKYVDCIRYATYNGEINDINLNISDFEATDWEIYEEKDNWSLPVCDVYYNVYVNDGDREWKERESISGYSLEDIKTLKQKILEDGDKVFSEVFKEYPALRDQFRAKIIVRFGF